MPTSSTGNKTLLVTDPARGGAGLCVAGEAEYRGCTHDGTARNVIDARRGKGKPARPETLNTAAKGARRHAGYTLLELMVVLAIVVLLSGMAVVAMMPALTDARLRAASRTVIAAFQYARGFAVAHRTETWVVFDPNLGGLEVRAAALPEEGGEPREEMVALTTTSGRFRHLPRGIAIVAVDKPEAPGSEPTVQFTPEGTAQQVQVTLEDPRERQRLITLDPITGRCTVEQKRKE